MARSDRKLRAYNIKLDGLEYRIEFGSLTPLDTFAVREQTGHPIRFWEKQLHGADADMDAIAVFVWLSRMKTGEPRLKYRAVLEALPYDPEDIDVVPDGQDRDDSGNVVPDGQGLGEDTDDPEASGGPSDPDGPPSPASTASTPGASAG